MSPRPTRFEAFASLNWYEAFLRFVANFIAKSSELLLAIGLIVSSANFLTDGTILGMGSSASEAWAWTQAIAIDSSLGVSFYYVLHCLKQRDWVKFVLYSILTLILTLVAGIITDGDIFSHAIHTPIHDSMALLGIDVRTLSILRSVAVVGFVLMSRLRDVSFKDLAVPEQTLPDASRESQQSHVSQQVERNTSSGAPQLTIEEVALLLQALARPVAEAPVESPPLLLGPQAAPSVPPDDHSSFVNEETAHHKRPSQAPERASSEKSVPVFAEPQVQGVVELASGQASPDQVLKAPVPPREPVLRPMTGSTPLSSIHGVVPMERDERLERAYQELLAEGQKISGRTLAQRAHVHRATCVEWLRARQQQVGAGQRASSESEQKPNEAEDPSPSEQEDGEQAGSDLSVP